MIRKTAVLALVTGLLASCGGEENKAEKALVTILPEEPIVITADIGTTAGPWFDFRMKIANGTGEEFTVLAIELEIEGEDESGALVKGATAFAATSFDFALDDDTDCKYTHFGVWAVGDSKELTVNGADAACPTNIYFRVGNNPKGGMSGNNFRYTVQVEPIGWFGDYDNPVDRFQKKHIFFTR